MQAFNEDPAVDAFLIQNPFPGGQDFNAAISAVDPAKDADGLHPTNLGLLALGATDAPLACTPPPLPLIARSPDVTSAPVRTRSAARPDAARSRAGPATLQSRPRACRARMIRALLEAMSADRADRLGATSESAVNRVVAAPLKPKVSIQPLT